MVSYTKWVSILFEVYPDADATDVVRVAGREWSAKKEALKDATVREARDYARSL